jgi:hypothetical protein
MTIFRTDRLRLDAVDYTPDIQIRIRTRDSYFEADCQIGPYLYNPSIKLGIEDVKKISLSLQTKMNDLRLAFEDDQDQEAHALALKQLAEEGHYAFTEIFKEAVQKRLAQTLIKGKALVVQITSEEFSIPWDALYFQDLDKPLSFEYFLGMRHVVSRMVILQPGSDELPDHLIDIKTPVLGLLTNKELDYLVTHEIPFFQKQQESNLIKLRHLDQELDSESDGHFIRVKRFLNRRYHILHLACHAENGGAEGPKFVITKDFDVSLKSLKNYKCNVQGHPVIFLNACRTSETDPGYFCTLARHFLNDGARALIATECEVPDRFAADFAEWLYERFLRGKPLGESLYCARRHFWLKKDNPLGLLYSLFGAPSVRFKKEEETGGQEEVCR